MKNSILYLGLCISLVCPQLAYSSVNRTMKEIPSIPYTAPIPSYEASSLSQLDEKDLEDRISKLPLPDNVVPIRATTPYLLRKDPLFPTPERRLCVKSNLASSLIL